MSDIDFNFAIKNLTGWQMNELVKKVGGEKVVCGILNGTMKFTIKKTQHLHRRGDVILEKHLGWFNLDKFYHNRKGLWVGDGFRERILPISEPTPSLPVTRLASYDLTEKANDIEICARLPNGYIFEITGAYLILATLFKRQENGKEGDFLTSGSTNILYVRGVGSDLFVVFAFWSVAEANWRVNARRLDGHYRSSGRRVFSNNY